MADLFRHFFWLIFPILGMGMGAFAIWNEFSRQKKALEVLKVYAEKGQEPPESVMQILGRASTASRDRRGRSAWSRATFFCALALGFAGMAVWTGMTSGSYSFETGWTIAAIVLGALGLSALVTALSSPRQNDQ